MAWSGGTYTKGNASTGGWAGDESNGIGIESGRHDTQDDDFAAGINSCLNKDGSNNCTGDLNFGGNKPVNIAAGTAAAPAICAGNDVNTGIFSPAGDQIGIATNGTEKVRIDASGNVGVGTTSPTAKLHIDGTVRATDEVYVAHPTTAKVNVDGASSGAGDEGAFVAVRNGGTAVGVLGNYSAIVGGGYSPTATLWSVNDWSFITNGGANERMRITSAGNVGIGTTSPNVRLEVRGSNRATAGYATHPGTIQLNEQAITSVNATAGLEFQASEFGAGYGAKIVCYDDGDLVFAGRRSAATWTETMRVDSTGNVGIGTTAPSGKFSVNTDGSADDFALGRPITGLNFVVSKSMYDRTTSTAANLCVESTGGSYPVRRSTSSIKYKTDVVDLDASYADKLHKFRPVFFRSKCFSDNPHWTHYGFIAEELAEIEPRFVTFSYSDDDYEDVVRVDEDGTEHTEKKLKADAVGEPEGVQYDRIVTFLTSVVQRQEIRLTELSKVTEQLSAKVESLEARIVELEADGATPS